MTTILLEGIEVHGYHGATEAEKAEGQRFLLDAEFELRESAASRDDLASTVDYAAVAERLAGIATSNRFELIETLARACLGYLLSLGGVERARVTVKKPDAPFAVKVGCVSATARGRASGDRQGGRP